MRGNENRLSVVCILSHHFFELLYRHYIKSDGGLVKHPYLRVVQKACDKAKLCGIGLDELKEILEIVYGGNGND